MPFVFVLLWSTGFIVAKYAAQGLMPTMNDFLKTGVSANDSGVLTQAPPNTGAGWYSLATGAWPAVKTVIRAETFSAMQQLAQRALAARSAAEVRAL